MPLKSRLRNCHFVHASVCIHYNDVIMGAMVSKITSLTIVYATVYSDADQRKHQCSASLAFVRGIHRRPGNSPHKWPETRKIVPFDDVIMYATALWGNGCYTLIDAYIFSYFLTVTFRYEVCLQDLQVGVLSGLQCWYKTYNTPIICANYF